LEPKGKIYFIADVHLGAPALTNNRERERLFVDWLEEIRKDAIELFLMGDIFDFWFEYRKVVPKGFTRTLGKIAEIADQGIPVHFFTGNHDMWVFDYLSSELGVKVYHNELKINLLGKNFYLSHGDGMDAEDIGYIFLKKIFTSRIIQWFYKLIHPDLSIILAHKWSKKSRLAKKVGGNEFKGVQEGIYLAALKILNKEHFDFFVLGHRHRLADLPIGNGSRFILLGEWIRNFSYGVFDGEQFELKRYAKAYGQK
jgi:UDP-2,3-diacylglucosamine hydrolase